MLPHHLRLLEFDRKNRSAPDPPKAYL